MRWKDSDANDEEEKPIILFLEKEMLSLTGFLIVYKKELRGGKFWDIAHDLDVLGEPLPHIGILFLWLDKITCIAVQPCVPRLSSTHFATGRVLMMFNHPINCQSPQHLH
jgi:hypothetical protein